MSMDTIDIFHQVCEKLILDVQVSAKLILDIQVFIKCMDILLILFILLIHDIQVCAKLILDKHVSMHKVDT